ncbi:esterase E4-like [Trichogramma pretiosum]|uniref:esterase E4-like n=1 Tax=Trichogramma pretiosum TaxID=7493 RepID=UPI0006C93E30|nr:esterase E4-like [Trichogramma pretiosum]
MLLRSSFVISIILLATRCFVLAIENATTATVVTLRTRLGTITGTTMTTSNDGKAIYAFRGLPYAEPPTGRQRFKPPQAVKPWGDRVLDATQEGPACPQAIGINMSEDCLVLNVYTKQLNPDGAVKQLSPVVVFIHPGGMYQKSSQSFVFGPGYLLERDLVLVTINYRLATLGLASTNEARFPGNLSFKDVVCALEWVRDQIVSFTGDPGSVTVTGQSAGSRIITMLMVSPMARGLFHRAIAMSGSLITPISPRAGQRELVLKQARLLQCPTSRRSDDDRMYRCLMSRPAELYGSTVESFMEWQGNPTTIWYPTIEPSDTPLEQRFLLEEPQVSMLKGDIHNVPLVIGITLDEFKFKAFPGSSESLLKNDSMFKVLAKNWYELAPIAFQYERGTARSRWISDKLLDYYFKNQTISYQNADALGQLYVDAIVHFPVYRTANLIARNSAAPVYYYVFTYQGPYSIYRWPDTKKPKGGIAHGDDLQYLFTTTNCIYYANAEFPAYNRTDPPYLYVRRLTSMWESFAKGGDPLPKDVFGNITWERYEEGNKYYIEFSEDVTLKRDFHRETMLFWDSLFPI